MPTVKKVWRPKQADPGKENLGEPDSSLCQHLQQDLPPLHPNCSGLTDKQKASVPTDVAGDVSAVSPKSIPPVEHTNTETVPLAIVEPADSIDGSSSDSDAAPPSDHILIQDMPVRQLVELPRLCDDDQILRKRHLDHVQVHSDTEGPMSPSKPREI